MDDDMQQQSLYHETLQDALGDVVRVLGGPKVVGSLLWPEKAADDAGRLLRHCLQPERAGAVATRVHRGAAGAGVDGEAHGAGGDVEGGGRGMTEKART